MFKICFWINIVVGGFHNNFVEILTKTLFPVIGRILSCIPNCAQTLGTIAEKWLDFIGF